MKKILITGSRNIAVTKENKELLKRLMDEAYIHQTCDNGEHDYYWTEILHGGAKGTDQLAQLVADEMGIKTTVLKPDYQTDYPKAAPLKRNTKLVKLASATIAIYEGSERKGGTMDTADKTLKAGKPVLEHYHGMGKSNWIPKPKMLW